MGKKQIAKRIAMRPFVKVTSLQHLLPTRCTFEAEFDKSIVNKESIKGLIFVNFPFIPSSISLWFSVSFNQSIKSHNFGLKLWEERYDPVIPRA